MLQNLTYKQKLLGVAMIGILLFVLSYSFSFSKTINAYSNYLKKKETYKKTKEAPEKIKALNQNLKKLNNIVGKVEEDFNAFQKASLSKIILLSKKNGAKLTEVLEPHSYSENGFEVQTVRLKLNGSFSSLTHTIHELNNSLESGKIAYINYQIENKSHQKKVSLNCEIHLQNFKSEGK